MNEEDFPETSAIIAILLGVICYLVAEAIGLVK
jgi:hypothetical protein